MGDAQSMIERQLLPRGITSSAVLEAMRAVPRNRLVPEAWRAEAWADHAVPIGWGATISQPYIVALMTELLAPGPDDRVLEIGTGSGYQAAVLACLAREVYSIEIVPELALRAARDLAALGYTNVHVRRGDGQAGWPEHAPFARIIVTAACRTVPPALRGQLAVGGRLCLPVGDPENVQRLRLVTRTGAASFREEESILVRFVPLTGAGDV